MAARIGNATALGPSEYEPTEINKPKLLIVDELGYLPLEPDAAHLFFRLVSRRYETGAMLNHVEPQCCRMGRGVRRSGARDRDPRPDLAPQPRTDHPRRQLPPPRQAKERPHQVARR
jgi:hypothetical protein